MTQASPIFPIAAVEMRQSKNGAERYTCKVCRFSGSQDAYVTHQCCPDYAWYDNTPVIAIVWTCVWTTGFAFAVFLGIMGAILFG